MEAMPCFMVLVDEKAKKTQRREEKEEGIQTNGGGENPQMGGRQVAYSYINFLY